MPELLGAGFGAGGVEDRGPARGMQSLLGHGRDELVSSVDLVPSLLVLWEKKIFLRSVRWGLEARRTEGGQPTWEGNCPGEGMVPSCLFLAHVLLRDASSRVDPGHWARSPELAG